jgi:hypothetical protein
MREYSFEQPLDKWHRTARTWFDGSVESVDSRLADCRKLLASSMAAVGSNWGSEASYPHIDRIASLRDQQRVLEAQRESLLTAGNDRDAGRHDFSDQHYQDVGSFIKEHGDPGEVHAKPKLLRNWDGPRGAMEEDFGSPPQEPGRHRANLSPADRRYVELEAAKFVANNPGVDRDELVTRAAHKAQVETSTYSPARFRAVTAAFCQRVAQLHRPAPRQRTAAAPPSDCADEMIFVV